MSTIVSASAVAGLSSANSRSQRDNSERDAAPAPVQTVRAAAPPVQYYGGIEGMNAVHLIGALQANGVVNGSYNATAGKSDITPPPAIIDRGA